MKTVSTSELDDLLKPFVDLVEQDVDLDNVKSLKISSGEITIEIFGQIHDDEPLLVKTYTVYISRKVTAKD